MTGMADERSEAAACSWCGTVADPPPATWTVQTGPRAVEYLCDRCTREQLRNIESSLPQEYW